MTNIQQINTVLDHVDTICKEVSARCNSNEYDNGLHKGYFLDYKVMKKYIKVIKNTPSGDRSVFMFVDKNTGEVFKAANWRSCYPGARYHIANLVKNIRIIDIYGSFLYNTFHSCNQLNINQGIIHPLFHV